MSSGSDIRVQVPSDPMLSYSKVASVRFIVLGGGAVTSEYYIPALKQLDLSEGAVVVDASPPASSGGRLSEPTYSRSDYVSFLEAEPGQGEKPECVIVALPNHLHVDAVRRALESGRHVLCEKPLSLSSSACAELSELAASKGLSLKVAMSRRYLPSMMLARDIVLAADLGPVTSIEVHDCVPFGWRPRSFAFFSKEAGGVLADMGVHYLDYIETLVGELTPISYSDDAMGGVESSLQFALTAGDIPVDIRLSRIHQSGSHMRIVCAKGEVRIDKTVENEVTVTPRGAPARRIVVDRPFGGDLPNDFHGSFAQMLVDVGRAIAGAETRLADASDAARTVKLIEWAYESRDARRPRQRSVAAEDVAVLVTGATGFIGGHLVERLSAEPLDITVTARTPAKCANISRYPVRILPTDLLDRKSVREAVEGSRYVYHLAYGNDGPNPGQITMEGTRNVVEAAIEAGVECVVVLSTMYVFGFPPGGGVVDESAPYRPYGGEYGRSKAKMEQWCLERAKTSLPTRIVILNPTCVFGPAGGAYTTLPIDLARSGQFRWISDGSGACNYTFVENLVDAMVAASGAPNAHGNRFIINDGVSTWKAFLSPFLDPIAPATPSHSPREFGRLPRHGGPFRLRDLMSAAVSAPEVRNVAKRSAAVRRAFAFSARHWPKEPMGAGPPSPQSTAKQILLQDPPEWLASLYGPAKGAFSAAKAKTVLGWCPRVGLAEAQAETIAWLIEDGRLPAPSAVVR